MLSDFFKKLFSCNFISIVGIFIGFILFATYTGNLPLPPILFSQELYFMALLGIMIFHFFLWVLLDKSSFANIKNRLMDLVVDYVVLLITIICAASTIFLINTFYF